MLARRGQGPEQHGGVPTWRGGGGALQLGVPPNISHTKKPYTFVQFLVQ